MKTLRDQLRTLTFADVSSFIYCGVFLSPFVFLIISLVIGLFSDHRGI